MKRGFALFATLFVAAAALAEPWSAEPWLADLSQMREAFDTSIVHPHRPRRPLSRPA